MTVVCGQEISSTVKIAAIDVLCNCSLHTRFVLLYVFMCYEVRFVSVLNVFKFQYMLKSIWNYKRHARLCCFVFFVKYLIVSRDSTASKTKKVSIKIPCIRSWTNRLLHRVLVS
jgi:hypothetical protein